MSTIDHDMRAAMGLTGRGKPDPVPVPVHTTPNWQRSGSGSTRAQDVFTTASAATMPGSQRRAAALHLVSDPKRAADAERIRREALDRAARRPSEDYMGPSWPAMDANANAVTADDLARLRQFRADEDYQASLRTWPRWLTVGVPLALLLLLIVARAFGAIP